MVVAAAVLFHFVRFDHQVLVDRNRANIFDRKLGGDGANVLEAIYFAHSFVENEGDDTAVNESAATLIFGAEAKIAADAFHGVVLLEGEEHAARIRGSAAEAGIGRIG